MVGLWIVSLWYKEGHIKDQAEDEHDKVEDDVPELSLREVSFIDGWQDPAEWQSHEHDQSHLIRNVDGWDDGWLHRWTHLAVDKEKLDDEDDEREEDGYWGEDPADDYMLFDLFFKLLF